MRLCRHIILALLLSCGFFIPFTAGDLAAQDVIYDELPSEPFEIRLLGEDEEMPEREGPMRIIGIEGNEALQQSVEEVAWQARRNIREATRVDWRGTALIVWIDDRDEFFDRTGFRSEFSAAAANAKRATVYINAESWRRSTPGERLAVMTHELGHLLVGNLPGGRRLPLWAEEGIVMHLANEWDIQRSMKVSSAQAFGQLPALGDLEQQFPRDPEGQSLAYAVSYLAIDEILSRYGSEEGQVNRLLRVLADDEQGPRMNERFWNPNEVAGWNARTMESIGGRFTNMLIMLSSGTAFWFLAMALAVWAYMKKKRRRAAAAIEEEQEEPWAESLTEDDVAFAWGEKEEQQAEREEYPWEKWERLREEEER